VSTRGLGACAGAGARQAQVDQALARLVRYGLQLGARLLRAERVSQPSAQVGLQLVGCLVAGRGRALEQLAQGHAQRIGQARGYRFHILRGERRRTDDDLFHGVIAPREPRALDRPRHARELLAREGRERLGRNSGGGVKQVPPGGQFQHDEAQREEIRASIDAARQQHFRRREVLVSLRAAHRGSHAPRQVGEREAKVRHLHVARPIHEDVFRIDRPVDDAQRASTLVPGRVRMVKGARHLGAHVQREEGREPPLALHDEPENIVQRIAGRMIRDDVPGRLGLVQPVDAEDPWVLEVSGKAYLLREFRARLVDAHAPRAARHPHCLEKHFAQDLPVRPARPGQKQVEPVVGLSQVLAELVRKPPLGEEDRPLGNSKLDSRHVLSLLASRGPPAARREGEDVTH